MFRSKNPSDQCVQSLVLCCCSDIFLICWHLIDKVIYQLNWSMCILIWVVCSSCFRHQWVEPAKDVWDQLPWRRWPPQLQTHHLPGRGVCVVCVLQTHSEESRGVKQSWSDSMSVKEAADSLSRAWLNVQPVTVCICFTGILQRRKICLQL